MENTRLNNILNMLEKQPNDEFLIYAAGFEFESIGNVQEALKYYNILLSDHPEYLPTYYQAAHLKLNLNDPEKAKELFEKGIELARKQNNSKTLRELQSALQIAFDED